MQRLNSCCLRSMRNMRIETCRVYDRMAARRPCNFGSAASSSHVEPSHSGPVRLVPEIESGVQATCAIKTRCERRPHARTRARGRIWPAAAAAAADDDVIECSCTQLRCHSRYRSASAWSCACLHTLSVHRCPYDHRYLLALAAGAAAAAITTVILKPSAHAATEQASIITISYHRTIATRPLLALPN